MFSVRRKDSGFSLIELAIVMTIVGAMAVTALETYRVWYNAKITGDTMSRRNLVSDALVLFVATYGRMPCPADPALTPDAPAAGYEACLPAGAVGTCNTAVGPPYGGGGMCVRSGRRDTAADGDAANDHVYVGSVPYAALGLSVKDGVDGWNNKMTYAVSKYLTVTTTFNDQWGVVRILQGSRQADGTMSAPANTLNPDVVIAGVKQSDSYIFALLSHGADGKGAYNYQGQMPVPCTGAGYDLENCDADGDFTNASASTGIYNAQPGAEFFDDAFTVFRIRREGDKWLYSGTAAMKNKSGQKVGVGAPFPAYTLDVGGAIELEDYQAYEYCSLPTTSPVKPSYCFPPDMIGGAGIQCVTGATGNTGVLTALDSTNPVCANIVSTALLTVTPCPTGQFMQGIDASGGIICVVPAPP